MVDRDLIVRLSSVVGLCLLAGGCATADATSAIATGEVRKAVGSNYRQLVAHYLATNVDRGKVLTAEISAPGVWQQRWDGPQPIVCARWRAQGQLIQQNYSLGFIFRNGQIAEVFNPEYGNPAAGGAFAAVVLNAATCGKLSYSPFPELMKQR